jgi:hypothetical protein
MDEKDTLVSSLNQVLKGSLPGRQSCLLKKFISLHKKEIGLECLGIRKVGSSLKLFTRNLFLPIAIGGLGIVAPPDFRFKVKKVQQEVAFGHIHRASCGGILKLSSVRPIEGYPISELETHESVPWSRCISEPMIFGSRSDIHQKLGKNKIKSFEGIPFYSNPSCSIVT